jgi:YbbR domain-containing protein
MPDWLTKDFHWKAFSLLMAVGIWLTVSRPSGTAAAQGANRVQQPYVNVPVVPLSTDANVHAVQIYPQTVTVTVSGPPDSMNHLQRSEIHASVNLSGFSSAENLTRDVEVALPPGATVVDVDPPQVTVTLPKP